MSKFTEIRDGGFAKIPTQDGDRSTIPDNSVSTNKIPDLAVTEPKLSEAVQSKLNGGDRNLFINANMAIAQRGTSFAAAANGSFIVDRFKYVKSGAMVHTTSQDTDVPTFSQVGHVLTNSIRLNLTTPDTAIAATDRCYISHIIEGYNWAALAQKAFSVSFWVKATATGTYAFSAHSSGVDNTFISSFTINATNTWEYKTISIPASPSTGTWNYTTGSGLICRWTLAAGTNFQGTGNVWQTGDVQTVAGQVNGVNTGATDFRLAAVMINSGASSAPFTTYADSFESELIACQRYYEKSYDLTTAPGTIITAGQGITRASGTALSNYDIFKVNKRTTPTTVLYSPTTGASGQVRNNTGGADVAATINAHGERSFHFSATITDQASVSWHWDADAEL